VAVLGEAHQQRRRQHEDEDRLDVVHLGITSCRVDATLTPPLEQIDHIRGELGRPLQLVMFGDFQCPFCLGAQSVLRRVHERLGDRLVFAFRHLPIPERHPLAPLAAEASEAAAAQGGFWQYHNALFPAQPKLSRETMLAVATDLGLDADRMAAEIDAGTHRGRIERDLDSAQRSGATGTPSFFVNGERHYGAYDASSLVEALEG
jgi:protein-disulfide isomerase